MEKYNVVDLFCGGGGGSIGIHRHKGFNTLFALDFWSKATDTYKLNFPNINVVCDDIHNLDEDKIKELVKDERVDIVIGGPPCQGFSMAARKQYYTYETSKIEMNKKNHLFLEFLRVCEVLQPTIIVMENVVGILSMKNNEGNKIINEIEKAYASIGYHLKYKVVDIQKLGLPQIRKRVIFIASKNKDLVDNFIYPDDAMNIEVSIRDSIGDLEYDYSVDRFTYTKSYNDVSGYAKSLRNENETNYQDIFHKPKNAILHRNRCSQIKQGTCMEELDENNPYKTRGHFNNCYSRRNYDDKMMTVTNVIKTMLIHPIYNRVYSIRETARLQNFPDSYKFIESFAQSDNYQILANAIPPILTEHLFKEIKRLLKSVKKK